RPAADPRAVSLVVRPGAASSKRWKLNACKLSACKLNTWETRVRGEHLRALSAFERAWRARACSPRARGRRPQSPAAIAGALQGYAIPVFPLEQPAFPGPPIVPPRWFPCSTPEKV